MLVKEISYIDLEGHEQKEKHYFNFNKAELVMWDSKYNNGLKDYLDTILVSQDRKLIFEMYEDVILSAYGVKSEDGKRFIKNEKLREDFKQTEAYSALFIELINNPDAMDEFINGVIPKP